MSANYPNFVYLTKERLLELDEASLTILKNFGVKVDDEALRRRLSGLGCQLKGDRVCFSAEIVAQALKNVTRKITFAGRTSQLVEVKPGSTVTHSTGGVPAILDFDTGRTRNANLDDFIKSLRLMDNLDEIDMPCALFYPEEVPAAISQIRQLEHLFKYSSKPVYGPGISSAREAEYVVELFKVFSQGKEHHAGLVGISPQSPLYFPKEITDTIELVVAAGIPTVILSAPVAGISGPLTLAGSLAQMHAEILSFVVIAYFINPETPLIYGPRLNYPNMKSGLSLWGLPEVGIGNVIAAQLARHHGYLCDAYGLSDTSCAFDNQAGFEKAINAILPAIAGAEMLSGFGSMANLMVASFEQLVIDDETFAMIRKVQKGVTVNPDTLALEVLASVLNGETFLAQEHTVYHLKAGEIFIPRLGFDHSFSEWEQEGKKDISARAHERVQEIIKNDCFEPLPEEVEKEINSIVAYAKRVLVEGR